MGKIYSVEAMISKDGKNYKGVLDFYDSKCILHSDTKLINEFFYDIKTADFVSGVTQISFLDLYTKEKTYIQVNTSSGSSELYIVDDDKVEDVLAALKNSGVQKAYTNAQPEVVPVPDEKVKEVVDYNENALAYFLNNPYAVLGIASNSSNADANDALEKIKRLDRLKVIQSYKSDYQLVGFKPMQRELGGCQNALASIKDLSNKWFWFNTADGCKNWQFKWYRDQLMGDGLGSGDYDHFLAQYLYLLIFDDKFEQRNTWHEVFAFFQYIISEKHSEILKEQLNKAEIASYKESELIKSFSENIFKPIDQIVDDAGIEAMLSFFRSIRTDRYSAMKDYKRNLGGRIAQWFIAQEKKIWSQIEEYIGIGDLNSEAAYNVVLAAQEYDDNVQLVLENALTALTKEPLRADMVKTSYKKVMEKVMVLLLAGNKKAEAIKYGKYLYKYSDNETKLKILGACGIESFPEAIADLPELMKSLPKTEKKEPEMGTIGDFEDITICDSSSQMPRVDFCGLEFNGGELGLKFWISNKTSEELTFWLMDVEVNGKPCCSTEQIAVVDSGEYEYYTYDLQIPDDIRYYSVKSIEFYVEIDRPGNDTIFDTNVIKVKCDTIKEKLSAVYED